VSNQPVTAEDLYLYAMQLLEPEEQARLESFLQQSPEASAELAKVRGDLALLALSTESVAAPVSSRQRLLQQVTREKKSAPAPTPINRATQAAQPGIAVPDDALSTQERVTHKQDGTPIQQDSETSAHDTPLPLRSYAEDDAPRRNIFAIVMPWAGWAVAAGLAVSTFDLYQRSQDLQDKVAFANASAVRAGTNSARAEQVLETLRSGAAQRFQLTKQNSQPIPSARVTYLAESGSLVFQGSNMEQLPPNKTYELWLIPVGEGRQPIPAGVFKPDERGYASVILPQLPKGVLASTFGVTMEDDGGSQTPTLPILMIGS
jgi:anti-sigma-K factor RskA